MILRGTRRQLRHDAAVSLQPLVEQLQFPWLCPAIHNDIARGQRARRTTTISIDRRQVSLPTTPVSRPQTPLPRPNISRGRTYAAHATQTDYFSHTVAGEEFIPFETESTLSPKLSSPLPWPSQNNAFSGLPLVNPSSPLMIADSLRPGSRKFRSTRGVGGSLEDIHLVLRACLQLGQLERASIMVRRLGEIYRSDARDLLDAHNAYLGGIVDKLAISEDQTLLDHMNRWFEVEMKGKGISPDETTFAMLIRATFYCINEKWVERSVRRLMDMAKQYGLYTEARDAALSQLTHQEAIKFAQYEPSISKTNIAPIDEPKIIGKDSEIMSSDPSISAGPLQKAILAQQQKGRGLSTLQESLKSLPSINDLKAIAESGSTDPLQLQLQLEDDTMESAIRRWRIEHEEMIKHLGIHPGLHRKSMGSIMWSWYEGLLKQIKQDLTNRDNFEARDDLGLDDDKTLLYLPLLQAIPPETIAATTIVTTLQSIVGKGNANLVQPMARVVINIGKAIEEECLAAEVKRGKRGGRKLDLPKLVRTQQHNLRVKRAEGRKSPIESISELPEWSANMHLRVGVKLVTRLMEVAEIETTAPDGEVKKAPAFHQTMEYSQGRKTGLLGLHSTLSKILEEEPVGSAIAKHLPMVTEPLPWTEHRKGGYLKQPVSVVRSTHPSLQSTEYAKLASKKGDMTHVYAALDVLGQTPWRINKGVYDVMVDVWNSGEAIADMPPRDPKPDYPANPGFGATMAEKYEYSRQVRKIDNEIMGHHSNRCFQNFQLEVAKAFLGKRMFFPHNMDFRGRAYPLPPYLNHMGADNCRGLLQFDVGKELGHDGLVWLKVHLANLYGFDKASLKERELFAMDHLADIHDSAQNPLEGKRWWLKAESPWQCLAACIELSNALNSPDPTKYVSYQPVHQDGTCNGLQHYAALGGDPLGAKQVNLEPGDRPSDIYTAVAEMTSSSIAKDACEGHELAQLLKDKVTRKIVKQTVMTKVYGVTFAGARMQVLKRLDELYPDLFPDNQNALQASAYIAKKIFGTLSIMFNGAQDIQLWLGECASRICDSLSEAQINWVQSDEAKRDKNQFKIIPSNKKSVMNENIRFKSSVIWTTPLKMPVVQPYRNTNVKQVRTNLQSISICEPSAADPVHKRKQLQAFPPNFIHSLDATHMFLTALKSKEQGLTFAAVHDSFWTHAADVNTMNTTIRESFIRMHSDNIIERLAAEFEARYKGSFYRASVNANTALGRRIQAVRKKLENKATTGRHAVSNQARVEEILLEKRRIQLLTSKDPAERAAGEAMMTPGRVYEEAEAETARDAQEQLRATFGQEEATDLLHEAREAIDQADEGISNKSKTSATRSKASASSTSPTPKAKKAHPTESLVYVWRPLTFPPMPKRGSFDVTRLRESKYFFS